MGRSRGGLTTKIHLVVDADGLPIRYDLSPGQAHDSTAAGALLADLPPDSFLLADKAYDAEWIRKQGSRVQHGRPIRGGWLVRAGRRGSRCVPRAELAVA